MLKQKLPKQEQGFTLVEVLVSILITIAFTSVALQIMVFATVFKVRAQEFAKATAWIQEDLENVKYKAATLGEKPGKCNAPNSDVGYAKELQDNLPALKNDNLDIGKRIYALSRTSNIKEEFSNYEVLGLTYSVAPINGHTNLTAQVADTDNTLSVVNTVGFKVGDKLTVGTDVDNKIQSISGNTITLTDSLGSIQPLGATVDVSIAILYTEVIPYAALRCSP